MLLANLKRTKGLRMTGVGGVTCSRHNMWRANGMGDLQVGERQCNMDYVFLETLVALHIVWLVILYNIVCQYTVNFWKQMLGLPGPMQLKLDPKDVWWMVPNFHLPPHKPKCHSPYSFHLMPEAGKSNGEGIKQNWAFSNSAAGSTRLMGPRSCQMTLEDVFGFHNYDRELAMHGLTDHILPKRLVVAIQEATVHQTHLDLFMKGLEEGRPDQMKEWRAWVDRWEATQHTTLEDSPFDLKEEEFVCAGDGMEVEREHTLGTRKLAVDVCVLKDPSVNQKLQFTKRRTALLLRIHKFRGLQGIYMPSDDAAKGVCGRPARDQGVHAGGRGNRGAGGGLRTHTMTNRYKLKNYTGQGLMTQGQGILQQINVRIHLVKIWYQYARAALLVLQGHGQWEERLRVLAEDDVRALNERTLTEEESTVIEGGVARAGGVAAGEGNHTLSWIWYAVGVEEGINDARLEEGAGPSQRYNEEVWLLREEMHRTVAYGETTAADWDHLGEQEWLEATPKFLEGRRAYAAEHATMERAQCAYLQSWWRGILAKVDAYLLGGAAGMEAGLVTIEVDVSDELELEEEEARLEGGEDE
ncbi:hypothetical protein C8R45DRAFT_943279 [Mycena sanguinolenta]|nr:hypothetical protein C8R45DRAFT_943279 [Mycena sanguinolenta]